MQTQTKAKQTSRAVRVWLENKTALESAGFHAGAQYRAYYNPGAILLVITSDEAGTGTSGTVSSCKRNGVVRPIIDLHSKAVAGAFNAGEPLVIQYTPGKIEISVDMLSWAHGE
jgi:predicted phage tail protein